MAQIAPDWELITELGGPAKVAKELGLPSASGLQTVQNWKYRGIPAHIKVRRPDLFMRSALPRKSRKPSSPDKAKAGAS